MQLGPLPPAAMHEVRNSVDSYRAVEVRQRTHTLPLNLLFSDPWCNMGYPRERLETEGEDGPFLRAQEVALLRRRSHEELRQFCKVTYSDALVAVTTPR